VKESNILIYFQYMRITVIYKVSPSLTKETCSGHVSSDLGWVKSRTKRSPTAPKYVFLRDFFMSIAVLFSSRFPRIFLFHNQY